MQKRVFVSLLIAFFIESFASILFKSPTWDETHQLWHAAVIMRSLEQEPQLTPLPMWSGLWDPTLKIKPFEWEEASFLIFPPLPYYLFGFPYAIFFRFFSFDGQDRLRLLGNRLLIYPIDIHFMVARVPMIFLGIILGIYIYWWAKELFGEKAGLLALLIYAFSPNILAHTALITNDIVVTCFMFVAVYHLWKFSRMPTHRNLILSGITLGLALLSKFSGTLLFPIYFLIAVCKIYASSGKKRLLVAKRISVAGILIFLIAAFTVWAGYGFKTQKLIEFSSSGRKYSKISLPGGAYINGIRLNLFHMKVVPRRFFMLGKVSSRTWRHFYLVGLLIKVPVATIIFFCLGLLAFRKKKFLDLVNGCFLVIPALFIFLYFSFFSPMNRGLRYILPVFPFVFVFIGGAISQQVRGRFMKVIITLLGLWYVVSSVLIFPHYLSYFNEFVGGSDNGYRYLVDSDLDWGQDLKGLKSYMERKNIDRIKLDYFGSVDPRHYQINYEKLESLPTSGYVAVSATNLQNVYSDKPDYSSLRTLEPVDKIGYSIFIYNLGPE